MTTPANIEVFNQVAAKTFVRLYETFPAPTNIDPTLVGVDIILEEKYEPGTAHHDALIAATEATIQFLIDEDFIRIAQGPTYLEHRGFQNLVLTSKGFSLLQKTPESIDSTIDRRSYIDRLKSLTTSGAKTVASEAVGPLIARILGAV